MSCEYEPARGPAWISISLHDGELAAWRKRNGGKSPVALPELGKDAFVLYRKAGDAMLLGHWYLVQPGLGADPGERIVAGKAERIGNGAVSGIGRVCVERVDQREGIPLTDQRRQLQLLRRCAQLRRNGAQGGNAGEDGRQTRG